jgi:hypothetical protein
MRVLSFLGAVIYLLQMQLKTLHPVVWRVKLQLENISSCKVDEKSPISRGIFPQQQDDPERPRSSYFYHTECVTFFTERIVCGRASDSRIDKVGFERNIRDSRMIVNRHGTVKRGT